MGKTEGNHNINNGLAKVQQLDKAQLSSHHSLWQSCGTNWSSERSGCWVTMVMFLPLPDLTKVWVHGVSHVWELRAFSTVDRALSPLMLATALLWRCLMGSNPCDSKTGMLVSLPWNNSQLMWWPESTQGTWAALPRGKTSLSYPKWDVFLSKQIGYKSRQMNKYRNMCTFLSKFICCSKCCQKSVSSAANSRRTWGSCF